MDIKKKIEEIVEKIRNDKDIQKKFEKDPAGLVKELTGMDIPTDQVNQIVDGIKAKIKLDGVGKMLGGLLGDK